MNLVSVSDLDTYIIGCPSWNRQAPRTHPNALYRKANSLCSSNKLNTGVFDSTVFTSLNTLQCTSASHLKCVSALWLLKTAVISESCVKTVEHSLPYLEFAALPVCPWLLHRLNWSHFLRINTQSIFGNNEFQVHERVYFQFNFFLIQFNVSLKTSLKQGFQNAVMIIMSSLVIVSTSINQYVKIKRFDAIKSFQQIFNASLEQFSGAVDISNGISTSVSLQRRLNVVGKMLFSSMITCQQRKIYEPCLNLEVCPQLVE